jgi:hypothetical protein
MRIAIFAALVFYSGAANAQETMAFAAAISPEAAFEVCHMEEAVKAANCALDKCAKAGGTECVITSACSAGWAGAMGVTTGEVHWTETVCAAPNEEAVLGALRAFCKGGLPHVQECFLASLWSLDGKEKKLEETLDPKAIK